MTFVGKQLSSHLLGKKGEWKQKRYCVSRNWNAHCLSCPLPIMNALHARLHTERLYSNSLFIHDCAIFCVHAGRSLMHYIIHQRWMQECRRLQSNSECKIACHFFLLKIAHPWQEQKWRSALSKAHQYVREVAIIKMEAYNADAAFDQTDKTWQRCQQACSHFHTSLSARVAFLINALPCNSL